jgi:hypothetical protein
MGKENMEMNEIDRKRARIRNFKKYSMKLE